MNWKTALSILTTAVLILGISGCQQANSEKAAALSSEDTAAIGNTIDSQIAAFVAKDLDKFTAGFSADVVNMEYERCYRGMDEMREKHVKPEMADFTMNTYKALDRHIQGRGDFAFVNERNIVDFKDKEGKSHSADNVWSSYVLEKASDGKWKIVQIHISGPTL